jgi:dihydrofolate reductase
MDISLILACDQNNAIGYKNQLLCHLPNDLKFFKQTTLNHCVMMGRKTFESIGKPLPNRTNIVLSQNKDLEIEGVYICHTIDQALEIANQKKEEELFVIGGGQLYQMLLPIATKIYLTRIHATFEADTFFPAIDNTWRELSKQSFVADEKNAFAHDIILLEKSK